MRARQAAKQSPTRLWADGLQLGVLLIVLVNLGPALQFPFLFPLWIALVALGALAGAGSRGIKYRPGCY
jgi:hypothetical protein